MIRSLMRLVNGEVRGMHSAAYLLGIFTLLSALLAFLRDRMLAHTFGAGLSLDLYYAAFRVPDLIFVTVASLVSAYVLIPELARRSKETQTAYIDAVFTYFFIGITVLAAVVYLFVPQLLTLLFPNLVVHGELITMTRIMLLQPILLGCSNIFAAIVQVRNRYVLYALSPLLYNLGIIMGVVFLYPLLGIYGLAWGVVLGAFFHVLLPLPSVLAEGFLHSVTLSWARLWEVLRTIRISLPRTLALSANHVTLFVFIAMAGVLSAGSITVFTFAFNLQSVPIAIIGVSYSVAAFPLLSAAYAAGRRDEFVGLITQALRHIIFWLVPFSALLVVTRAQIVRVILGSGAFDWADTRLTAAAFALLILALLAQATMPLLARGYYAAGRSWVPFFVNACGAAGAVTLGYWLLQVFVEGGVIRSSIESLLRVSDVPGTEVLALPLAFAIASLVATTALAVHFEWEFGGLFKAVKRVLGDATLAAFVGGVVSYSVLTVLGGFAEPTTFFIVLLDGAVAGGVGLLAIIVTYILLRSKELHEAYRAVIRRVRPREAPIVVSAEDELG